MGAEHESTGRRRRWRRLAAAVAALVLLGFAVVGWLAWRARGGEQVVEAWRTTRYLLPGCLSVDSRDGSCWLADNYRSRMVRLSPEGKEMVNTGDFAYIGSVAANPVDGSCWAVLAGEERTRVLHLSARGKVLWRGAVGEGAEAVAVDPRDGSCRVADAVADRIYSLSAEGAVLWQKASLGATHKGPRAAAALDSHLDRQEARRPPGPSHLAVNPRDGSCWATWGLGVSPSGVVAHLSASGQVLWRGDGLYAPQAVAVNPMDGSCWVVERERGIVHLAADGRVLWRGGDLEWPGAIAADPRDGSVWVTDEGRGEIVHFAADGRVRWRGSMRTPDSVSVNPRDGTCWVTGTQTSSQGLVVRLRVAGDRAGRR